MLPLLEKKKAEKVAKDNDYIYNESEKSAGLKNETSATEDIKHKMSDAKDYVAEKATDAKEYVSDKVKQAKDYVEEKISAGKN